jgi:hypothetical protein
MVKRPAVIAALGVLMTTVSARYTIAFRSADVDGNQEKTRSLSFRNDR